MTEDAAPLPQPSDDPVQRPFWDAAERGELVFQRCRSCSHAFLPGREECPNCLDDKLDWEVASGRGKLISWIVYHRAFCPAFAHRLPYTVGIVELAEGPRLISNIVGIDDAEKLVVDKPLELTIEVDDSIPVPRFRPMDGRGR